MSNKNSLEKMGKVQWPITVLSCDPGTVNFGVSVQQFSGMAKRPKLLLSSAFTLPITSMTEVSNEKKGEISYTEHRRLFRGAIKNIVKKYSVGAIFAERFQSRGLMGPLIETVSTMNAIMAITADDYAIPSGFIVAVQWKAAIGREFKNNDYLKDIYALANESGVSPHAIDARLIGVYCLGFPFSKCIGTETKIKSFIKEMA